MAKNLDEERNNSFFNYGGIEILSIEQDDISKLWKIKFMTQNNYVVSREFDRTKGLYANASDDVIRCALMDFSYTILGEELAIYFVIDRFIDRCFSDEVFSKYTENCIWLSFEPPSYDEVETILSDYNARILWFNSDTDDYHQYQDFVTKQYSPSSAEEKTKEFYDTIVKHDIKLGFMRPDKDTEEKLRNETFSDFIILKSSFSRDGEFKGFVFFRR